MKHLLAFSVLLCATCGTPALAQSPPGAETQTLISARDGTITQVVTTPPLTLHDVFGRKGFDIDARAFGGFGLSGGGLAGGVAVSHRFSVARELGADVGFYGRWQAGRPVDAGLYLGLAWRLR